ncbi:HZV 115-like protein [Tomelloso virus]|uniref:HZV 115-like protein n=1 Tax=Tomelloso virus TaxID=2053981 RepID=A0A2H4T2S1_9VIRU|nr:HZV 115-like protein [Tomelloso virus]ATY70231.1 HZV 115-like protein [Tomelloso virus]
MLYQTVQFFRSDSDDINKTMKLVLFLDGVSCVGKTTMAHKTLDFAKYLEDYPNFAKKNDLMHIQYLYDHSVTNDMLNYLDEIDEEYQKKMENAVELQQFLKEAIIVDRSYYSTMAYDIIFKYNGDSLDPHTFRTTVEREVFADETYCQLLTKVWQMWRKRFEKFYPNLNTQLLWVIPTNYDAVVKNLQNRGTFENNFGNLRNYVENQCWIFQRLSAITKIGHLLYVDTHLTSDYLSAFVETIRCATC